MMNEEEIRAILQSTLDDDDESFKTFDEDAV